jgi:hypothetical protein
LHAIFSLERSFEGSGDQLIAMIKERGVTIYGP